MELLSSQQLWPDTEVAIRISEAVGKQHYHYFHNTATCGVFGAAAAAGWLLGLTEEQFVWALGHRRLGCGSSTLKVL